MGWKDVVRVVVNSSVDFTASSLKYVGSVAAALGGAGFAAAQAMHKPFNTAYAADASLAGGFDIAGTLEDTNLKFNLTLPLHVNGRRDGQTFYDLADYSDPTVIRLGSVVLISAGIVCRILGDSLTKLQQYRYDKHNFPAHRQMQLAKPTVKEYLLDSAGSFSAVVALGMFGHMMTTCIVHYSTLLGSDVSMTYPSGGGSQANGTYYHGPLASGHYPLFITLDPTEVPLQLPIIGDVKVLLEMVVKGVVNITYGGGVFLQPSKQSFPPAAAIALTTLGGVGAYCVHGFFHRKGISDRDGRIQKHLEENNEPEERWALMRSYGSITSINA